MPRGIYVPTIQAVATISAMNFIRRKTGIGGRARGWILVLLLLPGGLWPFGKNKVQLEKIDWEVLSTSHFDVHYPDGYENIGRQAALMAEEANIRIGEYLNHRLSQVIPIFIYPSHSEFASTNIIFGHIGEGTGGFTESLKKRVVLPFAGSWREFRHVLSHELVHAFQYDILLGGGASFFSGRFLSAPPLWFMEGMAEYLSIGWDQSGEMHIRDAVLNGTLPDLERLTRLQVRSGYMIYKGGQSIMHYIEQNHGREKIGELFRDIRDLQDLELAARNNLGLDLREWDREWRRWLKARYYPQIEGRSWPDHGNHTLVSAPEEKAGLNFRSAVSPDGKRVAFISTKGLYPGIYVREIRRDQEEAEEEKLVTGYRSDRFEDLHLLNNRLTWSGDGRKIAFVARSGNRETLYVVDSGSGRVLFRGQPPLDIIRHPALDKGGRYIYFSGTLRGQTDIYRLNTRDNKLRQLTRDLADDQFPWPDQANKKILFVSNACERPEKGQPANREAATRCLFELDLESGRRELVLRDERYLEAPLYQGEGDDQKILFVSNASGFSNIHALAGRGDEQRRYQLTNIQGGAFDPSVSSGGDLLSFSALENGAYSVFVSDIPAAGDTKKWPDFLWQDKPRPDPSSREYPVIRLREETNTGRPYRFRYSLDDLFFGLSMALGTTSGFGGFAQSVMSDYLGNHYLWTYVEYNSFREAANFRVDYLYLAHRIDYSVSVYKSSNVLPFNILNLLNANWNSILYNPYFYTQSLNVYGTEARASYPFSRFSRMEVGLNLARHEETFYAGYPRPDIYKNVHSGSLGYSFDNVLYSYRGPADGFRAYASVEQGAELTAQDLVVTRYYLDLRYYFLFFERHILAWRVMGASVDGRDRELVPFQIGGFNTLRGYPFLAFTGQKIAVANFEYRFPLVDLIVFGWPVQWGLGGFSMVFFMDAGTAFNNYRDWQGWDDEAGRLKDLKMSLGLGLRVALAPGLIFRIDWGTPWDLKEALPISKWQGTFSIGYDF